MMEELNELLLDRGGNYRPPQLERGFRSPLYRNTINSKKKRMVYFQRSLNAFEVFFFN